MNTPHFCIYCGAPLTEDMSVCESCGQPIKSRLQSQERSGQSNDEATAHFTLPELLAAEITASPDASPAEAYPRPANLPETSIPPQKGSRPKLWLWILLAVLIVCCCGAAVTASSTYLFYSKDLGELFGKKETAVALVPTIDEHTVEPIESVESPSPTATDVSNTDYEGVFFYLDPGIAVNSRINILSESSGSDLPVWDIYPEHTIVTLEGYTTPHSRHKPQIYIFPVAAYEAINPQADEVIAQVKRLLEEKPGAPPDIIPFLPMMNAGQLIRAQYSYLRFENGEGVRFVTQYGQDVYPINNESLFYAFIGLTADQQLVVSAILPVNHLSLPDPETLQLDDNFYNNFTSYVKGVEAQLNTESPSSFQPDLALLDSLIASLRVNLSVSR